MRATEVAILPLDLHIQLHAGTAQKFIAAHLGESESIECEEGEAHLHDHVLHRHIGGEEDDMRRGSLSHIQAVFVLLWDESFIRSLSIYHGGCATRLYLFGLLVRYRGNLRLLGVELSD